MKVTSQRIYGEIIMSAQTTLTIEPTITLTPEQIAFYHENGYLTLDAITTPEEVEMLRGAYDRLFSSRAGREEGNQFDLAGTDEEGKEAALPQILSPSQYAPEMRDILARANAFSICRQLLGDDVEIGGEHAIFKPARTGSATPWHQDESYWSPDLDYRNISVWMPLQEATPENGCMQFIPGSHRFEVLPHQSIGGDDRVHGLELAENAGVDVSHPAICPLPAGGATFHGGRMLHYTAPNRSAIPRRALIMMFGAQGTPRTDGRRFPWNEAKRTARAERAAAAAASKG
jgi:ectoine hydroxylase-related dioxygenase (phytanoyl-CoA dioxygenase family)